MKRYDELTFEEVNKTDSLSTISDIIRMFAVDNMYWDRIDIDTKEKAYSRVEYLIRNFSKVINGSFIIRMKNIIHSTNKVLYKIEDINMNDSEPRKNILEEVNRAFRSSLYEISAKEVLNIIDKLFSSNIDITIEIYIENEKVYVDEAAFYFEL